MSMVVSLLHLNFPPSISPVSTMEIHPNLNIIVALVFTFLLSSHSLLAGAVEAPGMTNYTYSEESGKGPKSWGQIDPQWAICNTGKLQSPIDLQAQGVQPSASAPALPSPSPSPSPLPSPTLGKLTLEHKPAPAVFRNRGHDVEVEWQGDAGKLVINATDYNFQRCHWHTPSEHTFNGAAKLDLELHLVHKSAAGGIAVIGILYKVGAPDPFLAQVIPLIKTTPPSGVGQLGSISPEVIKIPSGKYYRYVGSLTTPPCTEGVIWTVLEEVKTATAEQIGALKDALEYVIKSNSRPIQERNGRPVYFVDPASP